MNVSAKSALGEVRAPRVQWSAFVPVLLCALLAAVALWVPDGVENESHAPFIALLALLGAIGVIEREKQSARDILTLVGALLGAWEIATAKAATSVHFLFPTPEMVLHVYLTDYAQIGKNIATTSLFLLCGFISGVAAATLLGIIVGWSVRAKKILLPIVKVLTPIPPLIYTPYLIVLMPSFFWASVAIIFLSVFWGIFLSMIFAVSGMDQKLIDMATTLNVNRAQLYFHILLPYCLPHAMDRLQQAITAAFMVLFNAEMIGNAFSGVGWYIAWNARFADYTKVVAGIFIAGVFVVLLKSLLRRARSAVVRWR
ncbi:MAG: ABC transporter permease subunit [Clostridia bacterium]|nr:ABC transporter permease subunit [Clostridia bacterium]